MPNEKRTIVTTDGEEVEGVYDPVDTDAYPVNHNVERDGPLPPDAEPEEVRAAKPRREGARSKNEIEAEKALEEG